MQPLKQLKQLVGVSHVKSCARVLDKKYLRPGKVGLLADADLGLGALGGEFPRIRQQ